MKLYVEINGEKHYIDEGVIKEHALYEGMITPFTGLEIKKEGDTEVVTKKGKETPHYQRQLTIQKPIQI